MWEAEEKLLLLYRSTSGWGRKVNVHESDGAKVLRASQAPYAYALYFTSDRYHSPYISIFPKSIHNKGLDGMLVRGAENKDGIFLSSDKASFRLTQNYGFYIHNTNWTNANYPKFSWKPPEELLRILDGREKIRITRNKTSEGIPNSVFYIDYVDERGYIYRDGREILTEYKDTLVTQKNGSNYDVLSKVRSWTSYDFHVAPLYRQRAFITVELCDIIETLLGLEERDIYDKADDTFSSVRMSSKYDDLESDPDKLLKVLNQDYQLSRFLSTNRLRIEKDELGVFAVFMERLVMRETNKKLPIDTLADFEKPHLSGNTNMFRGRP